MNQIFQMLRRLLAALLLLATSLSGQAQNTATSNLTIGGYNFPVHASVQATSKSGLDFNVFVTLPGLGAEDCPGNGKYEVSITPSSNLLYTGGNTDLVTFTPCLASAYCNAKTIPNNEGTSIPVTFKFKPGITCDGDEGTFDITVRTVCNGLVYSCNLRVSLTAVAKNYWKVKKEHLWGNLKGGQMMWKIQLYQEPHEWGIGDYNIAEGSISDHIDCGIVQDVSGTSGPVPGLQSIGGTSYWQTGPILSTTQYKEYIVTTICCDPTATVATNCVTYGLNLGVSIHLNPNGFFTCEPFTGRVCASKPMVSVAGCVVPFKKSLTVPAGVGSYVNYAQDCQGEYTIAISNTGNIPLTNLVVTDIFPPASEIVIFQAYVSSTGNVNMNYKIEFTNAGIVTAYNDNVSKNAEFPPPPPPNQFLSPLQSMTFTTTSGSLTYGTIYIKLRFRIKAPAGTLVRNCATLNYTGNYNGTASLCDVQFPPCNGEITSCEEFTVEAPKSIPGLRKCLATSKKSYSIGETIPFCITVSNHGSAEMSGYTLNDVLTGSGQNLELVGGVTYETGVGEYYNGYTPCYNNGLTGSVLGKPSWVKEDISNPQRPVWKIDGLLGECRFKFASYLVIKFNAVVRPQYCKQYANVATLTGGMAPLSDSASYNIRCISAIRTTKLVNNGPGKPFATSGFVNPPDAFQYLLRVENVGSVNFDNILLKDAFPACVRYACAGPIPCKIFNASDILIGTATVACATSGSTTTFTVSPAGTVLAPGDHLDLVVNVTRTPDGAEPCCNEKTTGYANVPFQSGQTIQAASGKVCVTKTTCCGMENMAVTSVALEPVPLNYWNVNLTVFASNLPIERVDISVMDYHFTYSNPNCKPPGIGKNLGNLITSTGTIGGGLTLKTPNTWANNLLIWNAGTPVMFKGGQTINVRIQRPLILPLPCCNGKFYYCLKVRLRDVKCRICEKIVCFEVPMGALDPSVEIQENLNILEQDFMEGN